MNKSILTLMSLLLLLSSCGGFQAKRVGGDESDEKALTITDEWLSEDTKQVISEIVKQIQSSPSFKRYMQSRQGVPKVFIGEVQNLTSDAYFPINDINDELLTVISQTGDFVLVEKAREAILAEITYQNDGMVDPSTAKSIGRQTGADLMIFGNVYMNPKSRDGKTIKQYSVNIRLTDIERAVEIVRARTKQHKYSER